MLLGSQRYDGSFDRGIAGIWHYVDAGSTYGQSGGLIFKTSTNDAAATERMRLDVNGNLGLGVTPSAWGSSWKATQIQRAGFLSLNSAYAMVSQNFYSDGTNDKYIGTDYASRYYQNSGQHVWQTAASGSAGSNVTFTQAMTLDASGNLLVGTTSPLLGAGSTHELSLNGVNGSTVTLGYNGALGSYIFQNGANLQILNNQNGYLSLGANGAERARIDSSGNLLVGTTSKLGSSVAGIQVNSGDWGTTIITSGAGGNGLCSFMRRSASTGEFIAFQYTTTGVGNITTNGTSTSYNTSSDYRLKNTVTPMTGALDKIALLKPVTYKWNTDSSDGEGFIAHELAEVFPQAVHGEKDAVDADGNPKYQGIDSSFLVATLTAAIQEQQAIITQLQADVAALKAK
jgi:hypothetical protein